MAYFHCRTRIRIWTRDTDSCTMQDMGKGSESESELVETCAA